MSTSHEHDHHGTPEMQLQAALKALRSRGDRITSPRRQVLQLLAAEPRHLSADDIADTLSDQGVHRTTAYRTLEMLAARGIVSVRQLPGQAAAYHLASSNHLHGHCLRCNAVIPLSYTSFERTQELLKQESFSLDLQRSTLVGLCADC